MYQGLARRKNQGKKGSVPCITPAERMKAERKVYARKTKDTHTQWAGGFA